MKNKTKFYLLFPVVFLASCTSTKTPLVKTDYDHALELSESIIKIQEKESFQLPDTFEYTQSSFTLQKQKTGTFKNYSSYSAAIDTKHYFVYIHSNSQVGEEGGTSTQKVAKRWIYVENYVIFDLTDDGESKTYRTYEFTKETFTVDDFIDVCKEAVGEERVDYKGSEYIAVNDQVQKVEELNKADNTVASIEYSSFLEQKLQYDVYTTVGEDEDTAPHSKKHETFLWDRGYFVNHSIVSETVENGETTIINNTKSINLDSKSVVTEEAPNLDDYTDITPEDDDDGPIDSSGYID